MFVHVVFRMNKISAGLLKLFLVTIYRICVKMFTPKAKKLFNLKTYKILLKQHSSNVMIFTANKWFKYVQRNFLNPECISKFCTC